MKKRIITSIIVFIIACITIYMAWSTSIVVAGHNNKDYNKEELVKLIAEAENIKNNAHIMAESARALGWKDNDKLIKELQTKWQKANVEQKIYQEKLDEIVAKEFAEAQRIEEEKLAAKQLEEAKWASKAAEYPAATQIWRYMKALGWNDYVCAGIMGNLMTEVGGQTLDIRYTSSSSDYYGMCQWNRAYSKVWGTNLETQCDFLRDTIKYEFDTYGFKYQKGFNFNSFLNMNDAKQAALAFAKSYERCASFSYSIRQSNAIKAYEYFVNN